MPSTPSGELLDVPTLVELCRQRAARQPDRRMFAFLRDGGQESESLTLGQLDARARAIAVRLRESAPPGARVLLSYPPGLDFVSAFFGCLYAGLIAVPVPRPPVGRVRDDSRYARLQTVAGTCGPALFLSTSGALSRVDSLLRDTPALRRLTPLATDEIGVAGAEGWRRPDIGPETVAYLQYTSGSTAPPRGVVLTHRNVLHNLSVIAANGAREQEELDRVPPMVSWLPVFHDMGLISSVVQPLFAGYDSLLMSPTAFVQDPVSWLRAISDRGDAITAAPSFGYEMCLYRVSEQQRRSLDLSGLRIAIIGDEPVRADTIDRFSEVFGPSGFRREAFLPSYGMAESTVMVSGGPAGAEPVIREFDAAALATGKVRPAGPGTTARRMVGCGQLQPSLLAAVVDPATGEPCAPDEVGEILVSGPSIGTGYWNAPAETARTFRATVRGHGDRPFLRTGSLGFQSHGQLFVTCRVTDLIVAGGRQYFPYDLEATASGSHPALRAGFCCAFSDGDEYRGRLVILAEIASRYRVLAEAAAGPAAGGESSVRQPVRAGDVERAIREAVSAEHGVAVDEVVLVKAGTLPFTTSNKLRRSECRTRYQAQAVERTA